MMKNIIPLLLFVFLMSCNSSSNSKSNSAQEKPIVKEEIKTPTPPEEKPKPEKTDSIFEGMYSYMADANVFVSCDKKKRMSVEMKGKYLDLERQYLRTVDGGVEVFVKLKGHVKKVPAMEVDGEVDALVLEEILEMTRDKKCD